LQQRYADGPRLRFFYQVWPQPLYSLTAGHLLSQAFALCGADNIVPDGPVAAPLVNPEFVLAADPDVIVFPAQAAAAGQAWWSRFPRLRAARKQHWLAVDDRRLTRPGPDMLSAMVPVCAQLSQWRDGNAAK
jgi:ABC-type Fe3+-hydroxamate transport system substrate-binding protein